MRLRTVAAALIVALITISIRGAGPTPADNQLGRRFAETVRPFIIANCASCHSGPTAKGELDLASYTGVAMVVKDTPRWNLVRDKLIAKEMPPKEAKVQPTAAARQQIIDWIDSVQKNEAMKDAGDPGIVLARRLSNAEYDNTIRDLTGFDIQPTREFPVDPSNTAGFDNSGESLAMSPALLNKYLKAAREVADHMYLKQKGFAFASRAMLSEADRDQFCENQIVSYYHTQDTDYADYFSAAWRFKNRAALGKPNASLADFAADGKVSAKYLGTIWTLLEETKEDVGPVAKLQTMWRALHAPSQNSPDAAQKGCVAMRDFVVDLRKKVEMRFAGARAPGEAGSMWLNNQYATHRMNFDPAQLQVEGQTPKTQPAAVAAAAPVTQPVVAVALLAGAPRTQPAGAPSTQPGGRGRGARGGGGRGGGGGVIANKPGDPDLVVPAGQRARYEASFAKFCAVFPDRFYTQERGTNYFVLGNQAGRLLSAGFLNRMGYCRDDVPFRELLLDKAGQDKLDEMWRDMDFIASATKRTFLQSFDARSAQSRAIFGQDVAPGDELASDANLTKYENAQLANTGSPQSAQIVKDYYDGIKAVIKWSDKAHIDAEPSQIDALMDFAQRAYRRPLTQADRDDILAYYKSAREKDGLNHEEAIRESIVYVLMSPDMTYRVDLTESDSGTHALTDYDLASRLSYFLWASMPDQQLLDHAAAGDLHDPKVLLEQSRRMLKDDRARGLALEFGGNWLDFRRFQDISSVDRQRFPAFTNDLRDAMFEEPVRFLMDVVQNNRSVLDFVYADDTFVNPTLAKHYGIPVSATKPDEWVHVADAGKYNRGGVLPMAVFLTKNAPGLRTSPVKRGNWVVKSILGERIAPPPQGVPALPLDEAKLDLPLREMLARHREDASCAACHSRIDPLGLVFESYGPVGEFRLKDLAGHPVDTATTFPDGGDGAGLAGLRQYIRDHRQDDYLNNLCGKLLVYSLDRSLIPSDELMIEDMRAKLAANGYKFDTLIESIVTSPQFLTKRGGEAVAEIR